MKKLHAKRLLRVAKACREAPKPKLFTMRVYVHDEAHGAPEGVCGTPGCAIGQYAARRDLQKNFRLTFDETWGWELQNEDAIEDHFGISVQESDKLFGGRGCGNARTPKQAAKFIEKFVKARRPDVTL